MKPKLQARQGKRPWLALLAAACLVLAVPAGRFAATWFAPAEDLLGYGGMAAGIAAIGVALLAGLVLAVLSLRRNELPRLLSLLLLLVAGTMLAWLLLNKPG